MQSTLKCFFVVVIIFFQSNLELAFAAYPVPVAIHKLHKEKKDEHPKRNKLALWSLILTGIGFLSGVIPYISMISPFLIAGGIVCGIIALGQIKKRKEKGAGLAISALVIGGVFFIVAIAAIAVLLSIIQ
jgi:hypothetical protein